MHSFISSVFSAPAGRGADRCRGENKNTSEKNKTRRWGSLVKLLLPCGSIHSSQDCTILFFCVQGDRFVRQSLHDVISDLLSHQVLHFPLGKRGNSSRLTRDRKQRCLSPGDQCLVLFVLIVFFAFFQAINESSIPRVLFKHIAPACWLGVRGYTTHNAA